MEVWRLYSRAKTVATVLAGKLKFWVFEEAVHRDDEFAQAKAVSPRSLCHRSPNHPCHRFRFAHNSLGRKIPSGVMMPVMSSGGVTSKPGLRALLVGFATRT